MQEPTTLREFEDVGTRKILALAWPALIVLAATPLYLLLDTAVVGRLGATSLAGLATGAVVLSTVTTQLTFLSYGTTARAARRFGAGRTTDAVYEGIQASWIALGVGAVLAVGLFFFSPTISLALSGDAEVAAEATNWLKVTSLSVIPALFIMAGNGWLRGLSNTRLPLYFTLAGVIPMAVTVPLAVRRWGLVGSAIANVAGELIIAACFLGALVFHWRKFGDHRSMRPNGRVIRTQLAMGRDLIARSLSFQAAFLSAAAVAGRIGAPALAAHQILLQLWNLVSLLLDSVAIAAQALVGAALGAGSARAARSVARQVLKFSLGASVVLAVFFGVGSRAVPQLFTADAPVLDQIGGPWWVFVSIIVIGGAVFALDGVLLGAADVAFLRNASIAAAVIGFIPLVWLSLAFDVGLIGVWAGLAAFMLIRFGAVLWRYRGDAWTVSADQREERGAQGATAA